MNIQPRHVALFLLLSLVAASCGAAGESALLRGYRTRAAKGDASAMNEIGVAYFNGSDGLEQDSAEAIAWFGKAAAAGSAGAMNNLGIAHRDGLGVKADPEAAHQWFVRAAELGHRWAQFSVGKDYVDGVVVKKDLGEAEKWLEKAAEQDVPNAMRLLGVIYYQRHMATAYYRAPKPGETTENMLRAVELMRKAADMGDATGQYNLGVFYEKGLGVPRDDIEASRWFKEAAEKGDSSGQLALGKCYLHGRGVEQDYAEARHWLTLALENGEDEAEEELANIPGEKTPVPTKGATSLSPAGNWSGKAWGGRIPGLSELALNVRKEADGFVGDIALDKDRGTFAKASMSDKTSMQVDATMEVGGNRFAVSLTGEVNGDAWEGELVINGPDGKPFSESRFEMRRDGVRVGPAEGESEKAWVARKLAAVGDAKAIAMLGMLAFTGKEGVRKDHIQALELFRQAAKRGDSGAAYHAGTMYKAGMGAEQDATEAYIWFLLAAERGVVEAQEEVGFAYLLGKGVAKNAGAAEKWFLLAAKRGSANAALQLGHLAMKDAEAKGGDAKKAAEAISWYREAAEAGDGWAQLNLAEIYDKGDVVPKDYAEAGLLFERAARNDVMSAQYPLGVYYLEGKGREKNLGKAKRWFEEALKNGDDRAKEALKMMPAGARAVGDTPTPVAMETLLKDFSDNPDAARAQYAGAVLDLVLPRGKMEMDASPSALTISVGDIPVTIRILLAREGGGRTLNIGMPIRGFCCGMRDGVVTIEGGRFIAEAARTREGSGAIAGRWEGTYTSGDDGESYRLRIDTDSGVELVDEGLKLGLVETTQGENGLTTVRAAWTADDGVRREAFFTGPLQGDLWEGKVTVTSGADVLFQGNFSVKK